MREIAARMFEENVEALNPKFQIEVRGVDWSMYVKELVNQRLTLFVIGWLPDYADPHNYVYPFMHSHGDFSAFQSYRNPIVDELIARGIKELDPEKRRSIYYQLQWIYHEDIPSVPLYQELLRHYEKDWVHGWYYNPIYCGGEIQGYIYPIYKK